MNKKIYYKNLSSQLFHRAIKNIYVIGFPPSPPPPFRRIDFYCPPAHP